MTQGELLRKTYWLTHTHTHTAVNTHFTTATHNSTYQLSSFWSVVLLCWRGRCASQHGPAWWHRQLRQEPVGKLGGSWVTCSRMPSAWPTGSVAVHPHCPVKTKTAQFRLLWPRWKFGLREARGRRALPRPPRLRFEHRPIRRTPMHSNWRQAWWDRWQGACHCPDQRIVSETANSTFKKEMLIYWGANHWHSHSKHPTSHHRHGPSHAYTCAHVTCIHALYGRELPVAQTRLQTTADNCRWPFTSSCRSTVGDISVHESETKRDKRDALSN